MSDVPAEPAARLAAALAHADIVFGSAPKLTSPVSGCPQCWDEDELRTLAGDPAAISQELLGFFVREVVDHWDASQYPLLWRRLAPRILRRVAARTMHWDGDGLRGLGSRAAGFADWPGAERDAVREVLAATLVNTVHGNGTAGNLDDLLDGLWHLDGDVSGWLDELTGPNDPAMRGAVIALILEWATAPGADDYVDIAIHRWLTSRPTSDYVDAAIADSPHDPAARDARHMIEVLRRERRPIS